MAVITTVQPDGEVHGMTANGVTSVSLEPPLTLACVDKARNTHRLIAQTGWFGISVLHLGQSDIARYFTRPPEQRTGDVVVELEHRADGPPVIAGALAAMSCRVVAAHEAGDHTIYIGEIVEITVTDGEPLMWFRSRFGRLEPL